MPGPALYLSVLVVGEIRRGVERLRHRDPTQASAYEMWLARLKSEFHDRTVPITPEIAEEWGRLNAQRPLPVVDGLLAATACNLGWALVTRNAKDFEGTPVKVVNPFEPV